MNIMEKKSRLFVALVLMIFVFTGCLLNFARFYGSSWTLAYTIGMVMSMIILFKISKAMGKLKSEKK